jgi:hypothetical protein
VLNRSGTFGTVAMIAALFYSLKSAGLVLIVRAYPMCGTDKGKRMIDFA